MKNTAEAAADWDSALDLPRSGLRDTVSDLKLLFQEPIVALDRLAAVHGPICGIRLGPARLAIVGDPEALHQMLAMPSDAFIWGHKYNFMGFVLGPTSIILSDGEDHVRRRASISAAFSRRRINGWIQTVLDRTDVAIDERFPSGVKPTEIEVHDLCREILLDLIVRIIVGEQAADKAPVVGRLFERFEEYLGIPAYRQIPNPFPFTKRGRVRTDRRIADRMVDEELAKRRANPADDPTDVLEVLAFDPSVTDQEIRDQLAALLGAGHDTTAASLSWTIWRSITTPGTWAALRAEADTVLGSRDRRGDPVGTEQLASLKLADSVMREGLRLHPAAAYIAREATRDLVIGGHKVPKGTLVLWSPHLAGRDPQSWDRPNEFDPERFLEPGLAQSSLASASWVPFGRGTRNCIGFALAQIQMTLMLSRLAQRVDLEYLSNDAPSPFGMIVNRPEPGIPVMAGPRSD